jgi:predicted nuclease of predicted toxin-antitoxin system
MKLWLDGQLSPKLAPWIKSRFGFECIHIRDLQLMRKEDLEIFKEARTVDAVVVTKDQDFLDLSRRLGPPPQILWITCGNTSNERMREIFDALLPDAIKMLEAGSPVVEVSD